VLFGAWVASVVHPGRGGGQRVGLGWLLTFRPGFRTDCGGVQKLALAADSQERKVRVELEAAAPGDA